METRDFLWTWEKDKFTKRWKPYTFCDRINSWLAIRGPFVVKRAVMLYYANFRYWAVSDDENTACAVPGQIRNL